ncbi:MAG: bactofilin family protein [Alphaproteobacteria bacterium]
MVMRELENSNCSVIGEDLIIQGNVTCSRDLMIEGQVEGDISCVSLLVGKSGDITGNIATDDLLIEGRVHGMIKSDNVELKNGCTLEGDIAAQTLAMDHGAVFTGSVLPVKKKPPSPCLKEAAE